MKLYCRHWGIPSFRGDVRAAVVAHASAAPHIRKTLKIADFLPHWGPRKRPKPQQAERDIKAAMQLLRTVQQHAQPETKA